MTGLKGRLSSRARPLWGWASIVLGAALVSAGASLLLVSGKAGAERYLWGLFENHFLNREDLAKTIRSVVNEQATQTEEVGPGIMLAAASAASVAEFVFLLEEVVPMSWASSELRSHWAATHAFLHEEGELPDYRLNLEPFRERVLEKSPVILSWIQDRINPPLAEAEVVERYRTEGFGSELAPLVLARVPDDLRAAHLAHGASLFRQIASQRIPEELGLGSRRAIIHERLTSLRSRLLGLRLVGWGFVTGGLVLLFLPALRSQRLPALKRASFGLSVALAGFWGFFEWWFPGRLPSLLRNHLAHVPRGAQAVVDGAATELSKDIAGLLLPALVLGFMLFAVCAVFEAVRARRPSPPATP